MRVLVLDRAHNVLDVGGPIAIAGPRLLHTVEAELARRGIPELPAPAGSRPCADGGRDFLFITERLAGRYLPISEALADDATWRLYVDLALGGYEPPTRRFDVWSFGNTPEMASQLAHLVTCGGKRVTMGWIEASRRSGTPLAYLNGVSVVTDGFGYPRAVVRSTEVREIPFGEIDAATAAGEGEGDLTHADWRDGHVAYFTAEAERLGLAFDDRALISVERFEVLRVVGRV
jgi:uncharacterized protein YhfF